MFAKIIICMNKRKYAASRAFTAIPLLTRNFFRTNIIKIRRTIYWYEPDLVGTGLPFGKKGSSKTERAGPPP
jgi:hypothetical protein